MNPRIASLLVLAIAPIALGQTFNTVGAYDATTHPNVVDVKVPSAAFFTTFASAISAGFAANQAGVVNFDFPNTSPWPAAGIGLWNARYGVGLPNRCQLSFGYPVEVANMLGKPWVPISGTPNGPGALVTSGPTPLLFKMQATQPAGGPVVPIRRAGLTVLQRVGVRQRVTVAFLDAGGTSTTLSYTIPAAIAGSPTSDVFFGAKATTAGGIVAVEVRAFDGATGAVLPVAIDDLAFGTN